MDQTRQGTAHPEAIIEMVDVIVPAPEHPREPWITGITWRIEAGILDRRRPGRDRQTELLMTPPGCNGRSAAR